MRSARGRETDPAPAGYIAPDRIRRLERIIEATLPARAIPIRLPRGAPILAVGLGLGWVFDYLFDGKPLGISVPLFTLLALAVLGAAGRAYNRAPAWRNGWLVTPCLFFVVMVFVRANALLMA